MVPVHTRSSLGMFEKTHPPDREGCQDALIVVDAAGEQGQEGCISVHAGASQRVWLTAGNLGGHARMAGPKLSRFLIAHDM